MSEMNQSTENNEKRILHLKKSEGTSTVYDWAHSLFFALAAVLIILTFFLRLVDVSGSSMFDTLYHGDKVIVTNFLYEPDNGDIVVISHGAEYDQPIIKRVIATEGQTLSIDKKGTVTVNGKVVEEDYILGTTALGNAEIPEVIPEGKVFVMGDNRPVSLDSRDNRIGLIDEDDIIGKAQVVVFPFKNFKTLN